MEEELQESGELPDLTEIKGMVRRRRWQFLVPFFCGWLLVWGASWLIPSTYRSGTLILVEQPSVPEKYVVSNIDHRYPASIGQHHAADPEPHPPSPHH